MDQIIDNQDGTITLSMGDFLEWADRYDRAQTIELAVVYASHVVHALPPDLILNTAVKESLDEFRHIVAVYMQDVKRYAFEMQVANGLG